MTYQNKTITKHSRGNWFVRVRHNGKSISIYGRTQLEAYAKLKAFVDKIESERLAKLGEKFLQKLDNLTAQKPIQAESQNKCAYTLKQWFDEWLNSYKVGNVREVTIDGFRKAFKPLKTLHSENLCEITNLMLSKTINEIVSLRAKDKAHNLLKQMFVAAFNNRIIENNPTANLPRPKQVAVNEKHAFTKEQEKKFIDACLSDIERCQPYLICVLQGLRKGEMLALRPNDFDFANDTLRIDESYDRKFPDDLQTKNQTSNRIMPMFALTKQVLMKHRNADPNERIFAHVGYNGLLERLAKLLKDNDLPKLTIHELRHTFISRCHEKGIDEIIVQKWVGHALGSRMTKAVYTHVADETERKFIDLLNGKSN